MAKIPANIRKLCQNIRMFALKDAFQASSTVSSSKANSTQGTGESRTLFELIPLSIRQRCCGMLLQSNQDWLLERQGSSFVASPCSPNVFSSWDDNARPSQRSSNIRRGSLLLRLPHVSPRGILEFKVVICPGQLLAKSGHRNPKFRLEHHIVCNFRRMPWFCQAHNFHATCLRSSETWHMPGKCCSDMSWLLMRSGHANFAAESNRVMSLAG